MVEQPLGTLMLRRRLSRDYESSSTKHLLDKIEARQQLVREMAGHLREQIALLTEPEPGLLTPAQPAPATPAPNST